MDLGVQERTREGARIVSPEYQKLEAETRRKIDEKLLAVGPRNAR